MSFEETLADAFADRGADRSTAESAAERLASFRQEYGSDLTADAAVERLDAAPYEEFDHAYDWLVGDLAAEADECTDSRTYRLAGFGDLAADPTQGA